MGKNSMTSTGLQVRTFLEGVEGTLAKYRTSDDAAAKLLATKLSTIYRGGERFLRKVPEKDRFLGVIHKMSGLDNMYDNLKDFASVVGTAKFAEVDELHKLCADLYDVHQRTSQSIKQKA